MDMKKMTRGELIALGAENDVELNMRMSADTMMARIKKKIAMKSLQSKAPEKQQSTTRIVINKVPGKGGSDDVVLGHNGQFCQIKRGEPVDVADRWLECLDHAVETVYEQVDGEMIARDVVRFPYTTIPT